MATPTFIIEPIFLLRPNRLKPVRHGAMKKVLVIESNLYYFFVKIISGVSGSSGIARAVILPPVLMKYRGIS